MSHLFSATRIGQLTLDNRIVIAPMCQYSADEVRRPPGTGSILANWLSPAPAC
ncbi:FMN oxidoreductase [Klebsiella pneumoniae]|uniref:FMN oxidoreductase n=1 Tax=Klebsiella pneumoniae TaxID=573 RepID=A0A377X860_KLEPN|nr:FMN oxidoreductase [Klebsiella pneumoniae]